MSAANRRRGGEWERTLVNWFRDHGWTHAERAGGGHGQSYGDVLGVPGWVLEAKNHAALDLAGWCDQAAAAPTVLWAVIIKRRGHSDPASAYVLLNLDNFTHLLKEAGY